MMWDVFLPDAWLALLTADTELMDALGRDVNDEIPIYPAQADRKVGIPSIEYLIVSDRETELFNPVILQVDYWARGIRRASVIERRIRLVTHRDVARRLPIGEEVFLYIWIRYLDSRTHDYTAERGVVHRSLDFQFEPLRARFHS